MSDTARLREDAERRCGESAHTIQQLAAENKRLRIALQRIALEDYRGSRPWSAVVAWKALHGEDV